MKKSRAPQSLGISASLREPQKEDGKPALVPKLRFPEFRDAERWEKSRLDELVDIQSGATPSKANPAFWNGSVPWVSAKDMKQLFLEDAEDHISDAAIEDGARLVPAGTLLMLTRGMTLLKDVPICVLRREMSFNQDVKGLRPKDEVDGLFLAWMLTGNKDRLLAMVDIAGHGTGKLDTDELKALELMLPSAREQQKIAECLSSVDEVIAAQGRKVDALKAHKKGLMQQLFPREGETQPRLRFPEFQNAGEWEEVALGEIVEVASGQVDPKEPPYRDYPQVGSENIESNTGKLVNVKSAGEKGVISGNYLFDENDVLYSKIRPALNKAAAPGFTGICSADIYPIRPANDGLLRNYLMYLLLSDKFLEHAIRSSDRGKIPKINREDLLGYVAAIPKAPEQRRIATCLSSLDALIAAETLKHAALQRHKRGLMQQLFPSPEEFES